MDKNMCNLIYLVNMILNLSTEKMIIFAFSLSKESPTEHNAKKTFKIKIIKKLIKLKCTN
jgi:hypothetical protein